jgi:hypothetical protein
MNFVYSLQSEWLKTKRSAASWLCIIGGFFIPIIYFIIFLKNHSTINDYGVGMWEQHFNSLWRDMAIFLLPMGVILSSSLITQMEYKNNTWKQLHTTPQSFTNIFFAKFSVILLMTLKFFIFFNIGIVLSGILPTLFFKGGLPNEGIPVLSFLKGNTKLFITCLPIIAIQYLISLNFKNFLVPIGIGMLGLIGSLIGMMWKYIYVSPYSYPSMSVIRFNGINIQLYASVYFVLIMTVSYILYMKKSEKG